MGIYQFSSYEVPFTSYLYAVKRNARRPRMYEKDILVVLYFGKVRPVSKKTRREETDHIK